jgi:hypothetical protein
MGKFASTLGWVVFLCCIAGALTRTDEDPISKSMKDAGVYGPVMTGLVVLLAILLLWLFATIRKGIRIERDLEARRRWLERSHGR